MPTPSQDTQKSHPRETLGRYRVPTGLSELGRHGGQCAGLPGDPVALAKIVQGLLIHQHIAPAYGVDLDPEQQAHAHIRAVADILDAVLARDPQPLVSPRPARARHVGVCRHFTLLHVALLRNHGVPARARCGFAAYFEAGKHIDHWVTEYWNETQGRWILCDAQIDDRQRDLFKIAFDTADVPRNQFLIAGDAWTLCRRGTADPQTFGILHLYGLWFIAGNIIRDVAALNNREMLPWDVWGAMPRSDGEVDVTFFDRLATLTHEPDSHPAELSDLYRDERLHVPGVVFNAILNCQQRL